jgi:hypothetical protein
MAEEVRKREETIAQLSAAVWLFILTIKDYFISSIRIFLMFDGSHF